MYTLTSVAYWLGSRHQSYRRIEKLVSYLLSMVFNLRVR